MRLLPAMLTAAICSTAFGQGDRLKLDPQSLTFDSRTEKSFTLTRGGVPVSAEAVTGTRFLASGHDYRHMIHVKVDDGKLTLTPSSTAEIGTYTFEVHTNSGTAAAEVYTPLSDLEGGLRARAAELGVSVDALRKQLGLLQQVGRDKLSLGIPPVYFLGQRLEMSIETPLNRTYLWEVNGKPASQGEGPHTFSYAFLETGVFGISYREFEGGVVMAEDSALVRVVQEPPVPVQTEKGQPLQFLAPRGFNTYTWTVDKAPAVAGGMLERTFEEGSEHEVTCLATEPAEASKPALRKITYHVTLK